MDESLSTHDPGAILDELRAHPEWTDRAREDRLAWLITHFEANALLPAVQARLDHLDGPHAEVLLRIIEAHPRPALLDALAAAIQEQPDLPVERLWDALSVLDLAGVLDRHPDLAEVWEDINEGLDGDLSIDQLVAQIEDDDDGAWLALQGLSAIEPESRPLIIQDFHGRPLGERSIEFLRLLAYSHDAPTREAALAVLVAQPPTSPGVQDAWLDLHTHHGQESVIALANRQISPAASPGLPALIGSTTAQLRDAVVTTIDATGHAVIVLSGTRQGRRASAAFHCSVDHGIREIVGEVEAEPANGRVSLDVFTSEIEAESIEGPSALALATGLIAGCLSLSGPATPPSWRYWVEATVGPVTPRPFRADFPDWDPGTVSFADNPAHVEAVLGACPGWCDASPMTFELAEEILLREPTSPPNPTRDSGAYRFLFERHLKGQLERYRRMLLWMAWFWRAGGDVPRARAALGLAWQLFDAQNVVPGHPFAVALTTRSLTRAQDLLRRGIDPRQS